MPQRNFDSWLDAFEDYTSPLPSPRLFRRWAGIAAVAGALERRVWVKTYGRPLYPNTYIFLVGPPGVGKTAVIVEVRKMWQSIRDLKVAAASVTRASIIDELLAGHRVIPTPGGPTPQLDYHSVLAGIAELGVFLPSYDNDFMSVLTDLYDGHGYSEKRRTRDINIDMKQAVINLVAGTTPSYLSSMLPEGAWDQGFLSRVINVYSGENSPRPLFADSTTDAAMFESLQEDFERMASMWGKMTFTEEAAKAIETWHMGGGEPVPNHPRLLHYNTRRTAHLLKLCMIVCAASSDDLSITVEHYRTALDYLTEVEGQMPEIFKAMSGRGEGEIIKEAYHHVYTYYIKKKEPMPEFRLVNFLSEKTPSHNVDRIIDLMVRGRIITEVKDPKVGTCYKPASLRD